jgi:hypothetical protein
MDYLIIFITCLHYLAIIPIIPSQNQFFNRLYIYTILLSTTTSIIWELNKNNFLLVLDYLFVILWFVQDLLWSFLLQQKIIIYLNIIIFIISIITTNLIDYKSWYTIGHIESVIKSIYVSYLIYKYD